MLDSGRRWRNAQVIMDHVLEAWLGWSRPPLGNEPVWIDPWVCWCDRCGASVPDRPVDVWLEEEGCSRCRSRPRTFDGVVRLGTWEGRLRELILGLKYQGWWEVADPLGRLMAMRLRPVLQEAASPVVIVPMPMPPLRRWRRGLDHARLLARSVSRSLGYPMRSLMTMRHGPLQATASLSRRRGAPHRRVRLRQKGPYFAPLGNFDHVTIVLVDDVHTTGRTAAAAARQLRTLRPARLILAVAAVSEVRSGKSSILV